MRVFGSSENDHRVKEASQAANPLGEIYAFPLSPAQERIWRADRQRPGNSAYNAAFRWTLEGPVDPSILERAFNEIIRRHEILRATFKQSNGSPQQLIAPSLGLHIATTDLRSMAEAQREAEMDRICAQEAAQAFDLEKGPLIRVQLLRMQDERYVLALSLHSIVCDGWSIRVIMDELRQIYPALARGARSPLPELSIQYPDFVVWQREHAEDEQIMKQLAYWKAKLQGYQRLEIETDFPRPAGRTFNGAIVSVPLPHELTDKLKALSDRRGGTMFITTLAACMALLHRYTGKSDISVGSPLARRDRADIEGLIGPFINDVVYREEIAGDLLFGELEASVRDTVWEGLANQEVPFERVIKSLANGDEETPDPFCAINFICQRAFGGSSNLKFESCGIEATPIPSKSQGALYDLNFFMIERESGWRLSLEFNTDLYRKATAQQLLNDFRGLLEQIAVNPQQRISEFSLSGKSRQSVSAPDGDQAKAAALEVYTMPATTTQERFWSFAKLDPTSATFNMPAIVRLSGPLSTDLLERSLRLVMNHHEILRTTFKEHNDVLIQIISNTANISLMVADLASTPAAERESHLTELLREEAQRPFDLAHGPLTRARLFRVHEQDHVLIVTLHHIITDGFSQGIFQRELWSAYGALSEGRDPQIEPLEIQYGDFAVWQKDWVASDEASEHRKYWMDRLSPPLPIVDFPMDRPPAFRPAKGALETLALPDTLVQGLKSLCRAEGVTPFMLTLSCFAILLSRYSNQDDLVIGSPVLNRRLETERLIGPFAVPVALRLDLSGNPTLREVLQRASQVTVDGLSHADYPFDLLAKDLKVRSQRGRNPLFQFYFLHQAAFIQARKLSQLTVTPLPGFNISTPFELQLAVIERMDGVFANMEYNPDLFDASTIRRALKYYQMLLQSFVADPYQRVADLEQPINRRTSAEISTLVDREVAFVAPRDEYETLLGEIWKSVFNLPSVGVHDNFFVLGGNSLRAAEFVSKLERESGITIDLSTIIIAPTIAELADKIRLAHEGTENSLIIPLRKNGAKLPLFLVHPGGGHLFHYLDLLKALPEDQPVYGLRPPDVDTLRGVLSVDRLAAMYIGEIEKIQSNGPYQLCGMSFGGLVVYEMATQLTRDGKEVAVIALFDTANPATYHKVHLSELGRSWTSQIVGRYDKYVGRLFRGNFKEVASDIRKSVRTRARLFLWKMVRRVCVLSGRPVPKSMHSLLDTFTALNYSYKPKVFSGRLLLFRANERPAKLNDDRTLGWSDVVRGGVKVHDIPGGHISMMRTPNVSHLAEQLKNYLAGVPASDK